MALPSSPHRPPSYAPLSGAEDEDFGYSKKSLEAYYNDPYSPRSKENEAMLGGGTKATRMPRSRSTAKKSMMFSQIPVPFYTIIGQLILLTFLLGFFAVTMCNPIALPQNLAIYVKLHEKTALLVVSAVATVLTYISTKLFTNSVGYALSRFLGGPEPISLYNVASGVRILGTSTVYDLGRLDWTIVSTILAVAVGTQTASWTTLLTPGTITVEASLSGFELDLASDAFGQLMGTNQAIITPQLFANSFSLVTQSGATAASTQFSLPSVLNFNSFSYLNSTGGTFPATWTPWMSTSLSAAGNQIPSFLNFTNLDPNIDVSDRSLFPVSFSMTQQGFAPLVSCAPVPLTPTSRPSVLLASATTPSAANLSISLASFTVGCNGDGYTTLDYDGSETGKPGGTKNADPVLVNTAGDAVFAQSCAVSGGNDTGIYWNLIIVGSGRYSFMGSTICSFRPSTTSVDVNYQDSSSLFNSSFPSLINNTRAWNVTEADCLGQFVLDVFLNGVVNQAQTTKGNALGDVVREFAGGAGGSQPNATNVPQILEAYVRGVMEFSVTLLRSVYMSENNGLFDNGTSTIPEDMRIATNGTYRTQTIGWFQVKSVGAAAATLIAPSIVGLSTIAIIIVSLWWTSRASWKKAVGQRPPATPEEHAARQWFDPGNLLHVITAASAGGLEGLDFPEYDDDMQKWSGGAGVKLGKVWKSGVVGFVVR